MQMWKNLPPGEHVDVPVMAVRGGESSSDDNEDRGPAGTGHRDLPAVKGMLPRLDGGGALSV